MNIKGIENTFIMVCICFIILLLIIIFFLIYLFFILKDDIKKERQEIYNFKEFEQNEIIIDYQSKKDNFIKKAICIMKVNKAKFSENDMRKLSSTVFDLSQEKHISGYLFLAMAYVESNFNNNAKGKDGEITYLQFLPSTWADLTSGSYFFGAENDVCYIAKIWFMYMQNLSFYFKEETELFKVKTILAYNCGREFLKTLKNNDDLKKFKNNIYIKNYSYDEKIFKKYNEFINFSMENENVKK